LAAAKICSQDWADWADWAIAAEEASAPRLTAMRKILAARNIDAPPNIFRSTTESFFE
jgi:hypothetical protein